jgi:primosomal protein N''
VSLSPEAFQVLVGLLTAVGSGVTAAIANTKGARRTAAQANRLAKRALARVEALEPRVTTLEVAATASTPRSTLRPARAKEGKS